MMKQKDRITTTQMAIYVSTHMTALGILTLPRVVTATTQTPDGWISVLLSGLVINLFAIVLVKLCQRFPQESFYQYNPKIIGKWFGILLSFSLITYFILLGSFEIRGMAEVTHLYLLPRTPFMATIIPFICLGVYLTVGGINPLVRLFEVLFTPSILIFIIVILLSLKTFEPNNIRPVLGQGILPVIKGMQPTALALTGPETMLVVFSFMKEPQKGIKAITLGIATPLFFYIMTTIFTLGSLGVAGVQTKTWPVLSLFRQFEYTGIIFERFETFMLAIWILQIFTTFVTCLYVSALGFSQIFKKEIKPFIFGLAPFMYVISLSPKNINDFFHLGDFLGYVGIAFIIVVPSIMIIIAMLRGKKHVPAS
ncbi:spore germination protein [Shimazuella sp. AN120528]|uniref:GerAB/ArcD/ProY family transporter n=1 Tax=Shimazuella soli TaxID=1892854 RepID=UPI001F0D1348|nr:GerAB/ArcD/ProY family transporter [Shimazuella soli]MCH5584647.1 spore germination protein [Shimazuella soli]